MERYAQGDDAAFSDLYDLGAPRLWGYILKRSRDRACAEDLMQQTLLHIHRARGRFRSGADVFPWMYTIAHRLSVDCFRKDSREATQATPEQTAPARMEQELIAKQLGEQVARVFRALPERQRAAYEFVREQGLTHVETAEALGTTVSAVKSLVHRAVETLRAVADEGTVVD